ncbi:MAG: 30S ribosomal protein S9 [Candidatus Aenigmarchaeota archaeon]|nr:30S ribosomal protein S9 [Candidatus Aenigmarchaeota archaeon]
MVKEKKDKITLTTGKRKTSVARARVKKGSGEIKINGIPLDLYQPEYVRMKMREALILAGDKPKRIDIKVNVQGGGISSQADAVAQSIAKGMVEFFKDEKLKKLYLDYDRNLLVYDDRRCEPHKPSRSRKGARRHKQRSKR